MLNIPYEELIEKIKTGSGASEKEIVDKIEDKLKQLSGLISKQGAAFIIAKELGVDLFSDYQGKLKINKILSGMRSVEVVGRVVKKFEVREFAKGERSGKVGSFILADETGELRITLWNDQADKLNSFNDNDIVKLKDGYVKENQGRLEVHLNDRSVLEVNPPGETVAEVKRVDFSQNNGSSMRKKINELDVNDANVELFGTIVQVFDPRFFEVCPTCGKRARPHQDSIVCVEHGKVEPDYSYLINFVLDDSSETIRVVVFRNQAEKLSGLTKEGFLKFKEAPGEFENVKHDLVGKVVKLVGRVSKNDMFDRLEFVANLVFLDPNPDEEIKRLNEEIAKIES